MYALWAESNLVVVWCKGLEAHSHGFVIATIVKHILHVNGSIAIISQADSQHLAVKLNIRFLHRHQMVTIYKQHPVISPTKRYNSKQKSHNQ